MFVASKIFFGGFPDALAAAGASIINKSGHHSAASAADSQSLTPSRIINIIRAAGGLPFEQTQVANQGRMAANTFPRVNHVEARLLYTESPSFHIVGCAGVGVHGLKHRGIYTTVGSAAALLATNDNELGSHSETANNGRDFVDIMEKASADTKLIKPQIDNCKVCVRSNVNVQKDALRDHPNANQRISVQHLEGLIDEMPPFKRFDYAAASAAAESPPTTPDELVGHNKATSYKCNSFEFAEKARADIESKKHQTNNRNVRVHSDFEGQKDALCDHTNADRRISVQHSELPIGKVPPFKRFDYAAASAAAESPVTTANEFGNLGKAIDNKRDSADNNARKREYMHLTALLDRCKARLRKELETQKAAWRETLIRDAHSCGLTRDHPNNDRCVYFLQADTLIDEIPPFLDEDYPPFDAAARLPTATANKIGSRNKTSEYAALKRLTDILTKIQARLCNELRHRRQPLDEILIRGAHSHGNTRNHLNSDRCVYSLQSDMLIGEIPPFQDEGYPHLGFAATMPTESGAQRGRGNRSAV